MQQPAAPTTLQSLLEQSGRFAIVVELETSRGLSMEGRSKRVFDYAGRLHEARIADVFSLTDNPGGNPHLRPETLGRSLLELGCELVVNVSCKDYNRNGLESRLWSLASAGFRNILALSGDYPSQGIGGRARPVFDVDSAGLLEMVRQMNAGLDQAADRGTAPRGPLFYPGVAVNPFKLREGEHMTQLFKLALKVRLGAQWAVTQIGYDSRKLDELRRYMVAKGMRAPLLGTVFPLGLQSVRAFHAWAVPGVPVSAELLALAEKQAGSEDKGRRFFNEFAARQIAVLRGLGYAGAHLSGRPDFERVREILAIERTFGGNDWKVFAREIQFPQPGEFYYFDRDEATGLGSERVNPAYAASKRRSNVLRRWTLPPAFHLGRAAHGLLLSERAPAAGAGKTIARAVEKARPAGGIGHTVERLIKVPLYGCRDCGDCSLPELAYLCPESQCAKNQRNGPCGGTKAGRCEVLDKDCVWVRAYDRLKLYGQEERMLDRAPVMTDASLRGTSSWVNALLGRDHTARRGSGAAGPLPRTQRKEAGRN